SRKLSQTAHLDIMCRPFAASCGARIQAIGMPTLTVDLPVYNNADDLRRSIPSVMNQTWKEGELRLLVVDDGSTDETPQVLEEYCRIYSNITVVRNATNQGRA